MRKIIFRVSLIVIFTCVVTIQTFAQCGADGTQPCPTKKKTTPQKETTKPAVSNPPTPIKKAETSVSKPRPQTKILSRAPVIEMVKIPAGSFMMGSPTSERFRSSSEIQHRVTISRDFYIGKYEITQRQWKAVMGNNPSFFKDCSDCPVEFVGWDEAQDFIRQLNSLQRDHKYRLPTEAEWEYAARAGTTGDFYGSLDSIAWSSSSSANKTHPVGQKSPNAFGLYDMSGNVWEWCQDWYGAYPSSAQTDPTGAASGSYRVYRGGSWRSNADTLRSAFRFNRFPPSYRSDDMGFRLVRQ